jgi:hypothetical protein
MNDDITSTEKLLDLIRKKRSDLGPAAVKVKTHLPARKKIRLAFMNKLVSQKSINVGIDIGHESLRLVKTEKNSDNKWDLIDYQTIPLNRQIRKGTPEFINFLTRRSTSGPSCRQPMSASATSGYRRCRKISLKMPFSG